MAKRPAGSLEQDIMRVLWDADGPLTPHDINTRLESGLAYTTVATVLGRLHAKGLVERLPGGRAHRYRATVGESELAVRRIGAVLSAASDRGQVLAGFVGSLSRKDAAALRALLKAGGG